jgi:WD40-like Beta Propeller Repeat
MRRAFLAGLFGLLAAGLLSAQPASAPWRTIETAHFRIHFPAPFEAWAARTASAIEGIHERVTEFVGYRPARKIDVLVQDPLAEANGIAYPFLDRPVMVLWTSPPEAESGIGDYDEWMDLVTTHEMAHIVHLTRPRNRPGFLERLLPLPVGPVLWNSPRWLAEGYATVVEGALTGSGRPRSSFRAMVLRQFAIEGKLPSYGALSSTSGWLGGSMAYLAGSAYLEWLEEREGKGSLQKLWKRMASRRGGDFGTAFRAIFGRSPADLYDRFRAEVTANAIDVEKNLRASGLAEGELWQRLEGGTVSPQVSPDGSKLLARRDPKSGESFLAVWTVEETEEEKKAVARRRARQEELARDENEVPDKDVQPRPRAPKWRLPRIDGFSARNPRWMPDGRRVLFSRRAPDASGALRWDLFLWEIETGRVSRVTRGADISSADPAPDGTWAAGVRSRYGGTALARVDLATGQSLPIADAAPPGEPWLVWTHPRVSPDGRTIAALLHRAGRWRVVLVAGGGEPRELATTGFPVGPPAWSPDGSRLFVATDASGIWNLVTLDAKGSGAGGALTRVTGGAFSPAPAPDGQSLYFLELTGKGTDLRRLPLPAEGQPPAPRVAEGAPVLPPPPGVAPEPTRLSPADPSHPYQAFESQVLRLSSGFSVGPDGNSWALGVEGSDVVGRLHWTALAAFGNAAGPRGGAIASAWSGLPVDLRLHLFSALEEPGRQRLAPRPDLDEERRGGFASASWGRPFSWGSVDLEGGGGWTRVEPGDRGGKFDRALGTARARSVFRRSRGDSGFALDGELLDSFGTTDGFSWNQWLAGARLAGITSPATLAVSARTGSTTGSPTSFDLFALGGASSAILPSGLDRNRIESPALPAAVQTGPRFEAYRAELSPSGSPLVLYAERMRAWSFDAEKPDWIRLEGIELRLERLIPAELTAPLSLYVGVARVRSREPRFDSTRGYAGLLYRP